MWVLVLQTVISKVYIACGISPEVQVHILHTFKSNDDSSWTESLSGILALASLKSTGRGPSNAFPFLFGLSRIFQIANPNFQKW